MSRATVDRCPRCGYSAGEEARRREIAALPLSRVGQARLAGMKLKTWSSWLEREGLRTRNPIPPPLRLSKLELEFRRKVALRADLTRAEQAELLGLTHAAWRKELSIHPTVYGRENRRPGGRRA